MTRTVVPAVAAAGRITADQQNLISKAVTEVQAVISPTVYQQSIASNTVTPGARRVFQGWPNQDPMWISNVTGVAVPYAGSYLVTVMLVDNASYGSLAGTTIVALDIFYYAVSFPNYFISRNSAQIGTGEQILTASGITPFLPAGRLIVPSLYHNATSLSWTGAVTMTISPIPYLK